MKMNSLFKCVGLVLMGAVLVQAQTMRVYKTKNVTIDYVVSDIDSIKYNTQKDTLQLYYPKGKPAIKFKISEMDSVQFNSGLNYGTLVDSRDGQAYKTIVIGTQTWMAQNLNYGQFIRDNGYPSKPIQSGAQKFCYGNDSTICKTEGGLYQWHTVMGFSDSCVNVNCAAQIFSGNHQGICPLAWHVPKSMEWDVLEAVLGDSSVLGAKMKLNNTLNIVWNNNFNDGNSSGFSAIPAGYRNGNGVVFDFRGVTTYFWGASGDIGAAAFNNYLFYSNSDLYRNYKSKTYGLSLRCVKD